MNTVPAVTSEFLYHCGVAIRVNYTDSATSGYSSYVEYAMENNFGFQTSGLKSKNSYSTSTWINMLKADINAGSPIYYDGTNTTVTPYTAHAWVIDGYKATNEFHCNWGWNGTYNDTWYYLTDLTPRSYNYNSNQHAIIGAEPILDACSGLDGADIVCSSNESYTVSIPTIASVQWTKSYTLDEVGGSIGPTYTVNPASTTASKAGWVKATIKNSQGDVFLTRTKNVSVMGPYPNKISVIIDALSGYPGEEVCPYEDYYFHLINDDSNCSTSNYDWHFPAGWIKYYSTDNMAIANSGPNPAGTLTVDATTCCDDDIEIYSGTIYEDYDCGGYFLVFTPNPSTGETVLSIESTSTYLNSVADKFSLNFDNNSFGVC